MTLTAPGLAASSSRAALRRGQAALADILAHSARATLAVTHGNLMALLLHGRDPAAGFATWASLGNPDVYQLLISGPTTVITRLLPP